VGIPRSSAIGTLVRRSFSYTQARFVPTTPQGVSRRPLLLCSWKNVSAPFKTMSPPFLAPSVRSCFEILIVGLPCNVEPPPVKIHAKGHQNSPGYPPKALFNEPLFPKFRNPCCGFQIKLGFSSLGQQ